MEIDVKCAKDDWRTFDLNENFALTTSYQDGYVKIRVPLRAGAGTLLAVAK